LMARHEAGTSPIFTAQSRLAARDIFETPRATGFVHKA